uniref:Netrin receptor unc5d n=1 Tax=Sphaerodactylus townsendi TaxID=933632 RepID=A0ACB8EXN6_9SAUR
MEMAKRQRWQAGRGGGGSILMESWDEGDIENATDIALYSGLGAAVIAVAVIVVAVTLYRRSHSEYGVDVIDSSALTGGFQTFNFKTVRQGW